MVGWKPFGDIYKQQIAVLTLKLQKDLLLLPLTKFKSTPKTQGTLRNNRQVELIKLKKSAIKSLMLYGMH